MKTNLKVTFEEDKLNALRFYMAKKELNVEDELQAQLNKLYDKTVPVQVREYVESQSESEAAKQEVKVEEKASTQKMKVDEGKSTGKPSRQSKRQKEKSWMQPNNLSRNRNRLPDRKK